MTPEEQHQARATALRQAARAKHEDAVARARRALIALDARNEVINFNSVAREAGVSKDFLYKNEELADRIRRARSQRTAAGRSRPNREQPSERSALVQLEVLRAEATRLRAEVAQLRQENAVLRGELISRRGKR